MFVGNLYIFFGEMFIQVFCPFWIGLFAFLILSCMSCLYILEINPLSVASFANIFSHSERCLFILFMVSFAVQKLLTFITSHLFIFVLFPFVYEVGQKGSCCDLCHRVFCFCFPLRVLQCLVLHLRLLSILSSFLCMMLGSVLTSYFCMYLSSFPSTTY